MASLIWFRLNINTSPPPLRCQNIHHSSLTKISRVLHIKQTSPSFSKLRCAKRLDWQSSLPFSSTQSSDDIIKGNDVVEPIHAEEATEFQVLQTDEHVVDVKTKHVAPGKSFRLPMWLLGPSVLLITGVVPTLWLPLSSVFLGPTIAGLLALVGLDCIFNMGAMLFLLMADACGRPYNSPSESADRISNSYKLWNVGASIAGLIVPVALLYASHKGSLQPQMHIVPSAVLLGPYLLLLATQMLSEILTWHWKSPVWLVAPVVYEAYRVLQLMRGLTLASDVAAPPWMVESLRYLVSWWVLVLGIQLMQIAQFAGLAPSSESFASSSE